MPQAVLRETNLVLVSLIFKPKTNKEKKNKIRDRKLFLEMSNFQTA